MYDEAVRYITDKIKMKPEIGIVLGSGLGDAFTVDDPVYINYKEVRASLFRQLPAIRDDLYLVIPVENRLLSCRSEFITMRDIPCRMS